MPVQMIPQIKHLGETGAGEGFFIPAAVVGLLLDEPVDALFHGRIGWADAGDQAHDAPGGLAGGAFALAFEAGVFVAAAGFAEAAVGFLNAL